MRPNERVRTTPGHVLQWYGPNCGTSVLTVRAYHFFWSRLFVWAENVLVALKAEALSLLWGRGFLLCGVAVAVREFKYLWACLAKATFIIIRLVCTPERQSQNHPESSYWKQRWGTFQQVVKLRKVFFFFSKFRERSEQARKWDDVLNCLCSGKTLMERGERKALVI